MTAEPPTVRQVPEPCGRVGADRQDLVAVRRESCPQQAAAVVERRGERHAVSASQTRAVPSKPAVTTRAPSGLKQASRTPIAVHGSHRP